MKKAFTDKDKNEIRDYLRQNKDTYGAYIAINARFQHNISVSKPAFRNIHNNFKKSRKAGTPFDQAANKLIIDLQNSISDFDADELSKSTKKLKPMEVYNNRQSDKERACLMIELIHAPKGSGKTIMSLPMLIRYKSYLTESEKKNQQQEASFFPIAHHGIKPFSEYGYICQVLGIPFSNYYSSESLQEDVSAINRIIVHRLNILNDRLDKRIAKLLAESPEKTKKWFIDVFNESSDKYIPEWREILAKRSKNIPKYKNDYGLWKKSLKVKTKKEAGVKREAGTRYHARMIRGEMFFLKQIYDLLYGEIDKERKRLQKMLNEVFTILDECSIHDIVVKVIPQLQTRYKTTGNYLDSSQNRNHFLPFKDLDKYDKLKPKK